MLRALIYGIIASGALLIGAALAVVLGGPAGDDESEPEHQKRDRRIERVTLAVMAFGAGVLLCTLAFDLMEDATTKAASTTSHWASFQARSCSLSLIHISEPTRLGMISYA